MITENGWPSCGIDGCTSNPIPGTNVSIPLQSGIPNTIMKAFAAAFNVNVQPLRQADTGGWTPTNSVATSNHLGGTAMDLRWEDHPMGNAYAGYSADQIATVREMLAFFEGMIFWGNDWTSPKDSMHFQMGYGTFNNQAKCNDFIRRKIQSNGVSTFRQGPVDPNAFPLPSGYYWGPLDAPDQSISGQANEDQSWLDGLGRWQASLGIPVTKKWDAATMNAATVLQKQKGWPPNPDIKVNGGFGGVYEGEWNVVIRDGWRLPGAGPAPAPTPKPVIVGPANDQLNMRFLKLGGQTLVEAVAEIRDHLLGTSDKDKEGVVVE
jgi:hypothetical protein